MHTRTKVYNLDNFEIEIRSINKPDPHLAAKAILPLILEILNKRISLEKKVKHKVIV
jgi:hypothetical protein